MSSALPACEESTPSAPPVYTPPSQLPTRPQSPAPSISASTLDLPSYTTKPTTEPNTLSRTCFLWGFLCPILWMIAVAILFMDLRYEPDLSSEEGEGETSVEEQVKRERDAQVIAESILIIRKAEIRWSRYCAVALGIEIVIVLVVVGIVVAASVAR